MPRTKASKNNANKRVRDQPPREVEELAEAFLNNLDEEYAQTMRNLDSQFNRLRSKTPAHVLNMTLGDLRALQASKFNEIATPMATNPQRASNNDEGYASQRGSAVTNDPPQTIGPFRSAALNRRRRSKSSTGYLQARPGLKKMTPMLGASGGGGGDHRSRSRMRTPLMNPRPKAASADRLYITPKVAPNTPLAVMRQAKVGEAIYAVTGSPVMSVNFGEKIPNVNIPTAAGGFLSLRPEHAAAISPTYVKKIDKRTLRDLKQLQANLNRFMQIAEGQHGGQE